MLPAHGFANIYLSPCFQSNLFSKKLDGACVDPSWVSGCERRLAWESGHWSYSSLPWSSRSPGASHTPSLGHSFPTSELRKSLPASSSTPRWLCMRHSVPRLAQSTLLSFCLFLCRSTSGVGSWHEQIYRSQFWVFLSGLAAHGI